jgi:hypothetical protein
MGIETWVTSDGRVYFVRLHENVGSDISVSGSTEDEGPQVCVLLFSLFVRFNLDVGRRTETPPTLNIV